MSGSEIVTGVVTALIGVGGLIMAPKVWAGYLTRAGARFRGRPYSNGGLALIWWPFGDATRRGMIRGFVPMLAKCCQQSSGAPDARRRSASAECSSATGTPTHS